MIERFFMGLMRSNEIKSDTYLCSFMSTNDKKLYLSHIKAMEKAAESKKV